MSTRRFVSFLGRFAAALAFVFALPLGTLGTAHAEGPPAGPQGVVNINTARAEELMLLPRIGEEKARRIIEQRTKAPFKNVNELTRVKGIGLRTLRSLKPYVRIDGPTTLTSEARPSAATSDDVGPSESPTPSTAKPQRAASPSH